MTCVDCKQNLASGHLVIDYYDKRQQLVKHWNFKYKLGLVKWPRRSGVGARLCMRIPKHDMRRTDVTRCALYSRHSDFLLRDVADNESPTIGNGLFSHLPYIKGDVIAQFFGVIMSREDYDEEAAALGRGGCCIQLTRGRVLQCYESCINGDCLASLANSAHHSLHQRHYKSTSSEQLQNHCQ